MIPLLLGVACALALGAAIAAALTLATYDNRKDRT